MIQLFLLLWGEFDLWLFPFRWFLLIEQEMFLAKIEVKDGLLLLIECTCIRLLLLVVFLLYELRPFGFALCPIHLLILLLVSLALILAWGHIIINYDICILNH